MSKPISSYPKEQQNKVATKRIASKTMGLGYWSAIAYMERKNNANSK